MTYRVFAQRADPTVDVAALVRAVQMHFRPIMRVDVLGESMLAGGMVHRVEIRVELASGESRQRTLLARTKTDTDQDDAETAERVGQAAGMAALAGRCPVVIEVSGGDTDADNAVERAATLRVCAAVAATHLGPVLPGHDRHVIRRARRETKRAAAALAES